MSEGNDKLGIAPFDGSNFANWSYRMRFLLQEKDVLSHVETVAPAVAARGAEWKKTEQKAMHLLIRCLHDDLLEFTRDCPLSYDLWRKLSTTYMRKSIARRVFLTQQLFDLRLEAEENLNGFFLRFDKAVRELKDAGEALEEAAVIVRLMIIMPDEYRSTISALETIDEATLTLAKVKSCLLEHEIRLNGKNAGTDEPSGHAMFLKKAAGSSQGKKKPGKRQCYTCGSEKHLQRDCPKFKEQQANVAARDKAFSMVSMCNVTEHSFQFVLDSGSSEHLINDRNLLTNLRKVDPFTISIAKEGVKLSSNESGLIIGTTFCNGEEKLVNVNDVHYVPELKFNLISVRKLVANGNLVVFDGDEARISKNGETFAIAKSSGGVFWLDIKVQQERHANLAAGAEGNWLWHRRLGHLDMRNVCELVRQDMATGIDMKVSDELSSICDSCVRAKLARLAFNGTRKRATKPLQIVHSDVCGPIDPVGLNGEKYFVTFIDDWSHMCVVYTMKSKAETIDKMKEFYEMATAHFGTKMKKLRCDNGGEYRSWKMKKFAKKKGFRIHFIPPYSPQLNGVAERMNRTLVEKCRAMLLDACLDKKFWPEALMNAVYVTNRSPTVALERKTPFEAWFREKPNLSNLRIFGCRAYVVDAKGHIKKLEDRSHLCEFLGYGDSGWRLWDPVKNRVVVSRDVKFDERENGKRSVEVNLDDEDSLSIESEIVDEDFESANDEVEEAQPEPIPVVIKRPVRERRPPARYADYDCSLALLAESIMSDAPTGYNKIEGRSDEKEWMQAVSEEVDSLQRNST